MTETLPLKGIIPPLATPFRDRQVDVESLRNLIHHVMDAGVHGLFMLGTTSEIGALTDSQRLEVLRCAVETSNGRLPVYAGVIDMGTNAVIEHARRAQAAGADGLVVTGPYYISPSDDEIVRHYALIAEAVPLPTIAYNIPTTMFTKLEPKVVGRIAKERYAVALKDSGRSDANFRKMVLATRDVPGFSCLTGSETTIDFAMLAGGHGAVPGLGNVDPAGYVRLFNALEAKDFETARGEQERLVALGAIRSQAKRKAVGSTAVSIGGYKTALRELGVIATNEMAAPMTALGDDEADGVRAVLVEAGLLGE